MLSIVLSAGWPIWPLLLTSVLALALIVDRALALRMGRILPPNLTEQAVQATVRRTANDGALQLLAKGSPLGAVLAEGVRQAQKGTSRAAIHEALERAGRKQSHHLEKHLNALATIATAAPLMGLLGTVVGMIDIFASQQAGGQPQQLAVGISIALYNTAFGLLVAIPALVAWRVFRRRVDDCIMQLEAEAAVFLEGVAPTPAAGA